jgi:hypothetical protein
MKRLLLLLALIPAAAWADDVPVKTPTETEKVEALRLGYILNGFSMTRHPSEGSIDVSLYRRHTALPSTVPPQIPGVVRTIPIDTGKRDALVVTPPPEEPPDVFPEPPAKETDVCARNGKRKVVTDGGKSWRCR